MALPTYGDLTWSRAIDHPELLAPTTHAALVAWAATEPEVADLVAVTEIDPALSDTAALSEAHGLPLELSVNCVLVAGRREGIERTAAAAVRASTRADVNGLVKRMLDVRKASFVPVERAVAETGMEYGGITPLGLPAGWRVLVDVGATRGMPALLGAGVRHGKILLDAPTFARMPGVEVIDGLALGAA